MSSPKPGILRAMVPAALSREMAAGPVGPTGAAGPGSAPNRRDRRQMARILSNTLKRELRGGGVAR